MSTNAPHRAIYRRWRAQTFEQIVGQEATVTSLRHAVRSGRLAHGLLFVGPRGTGKTSTARIVAKAVNCLAPADGEPCDACEPCAEIREGRALDVVEMDAASNNKVEDMRDFLPRVWTAPSSLRRKVFIVDEVQRIRDGWDVLLKTLEEPPDHVVFIFCTTDAGGVRPAVLSRLQRFDFTRLTEAQIAGKLRAILAADGREADDAAVALLARLADGGMRDAESMLDQLLSGGDERLTADRVRDQLGLADDEAVEAFLAALVDGDPLVGIGVLDALDERGRDLRAFVEQCVDALRRAIVAALGPAADRGAVSLGDRAPSALAAAARRLVGADPSRAGRGGLRFELELELLEAGERRGRGDAPHPAALAAAAVPSVPAATASPPPPPTPGRGSRPAAAAATPAPPAPPPAASPAPPPAASPAPRKASSPARVEVAAPASSGAAAEPVDLQEILAAWPRIVAVVGENPAVKPIIATCAPIGVDDGVVTVAFPEAQGFLKERAEKRRGDIERGFDVALGRRVGIRFATSNVVPALPSEERDAQHLLDEAKRIFADDIAGVGDVD
ncbi:MAG: DNA polymerase III subunit gamma/tau [Chloroflexi bacterium]|nr:DNA polymerase III subunit gamma/tau [Chloroflexota bacterium]